MKLNALKSSWWKLEWPSDEPDTCFLQLNCSFAFQLISVIYQYVSPLKAWENFDYANMHIKEIFNTVSMKGQILLDKTEIAMWDSSSWDLFLTFSSPVFKNDSVFMEKQINMVLTPPFRASAVFLVLYT